MGALLAPVVGLDKNGLKSLWSERQSPNPA
jgi:hypothetical protein